MCMVVFEKQSISDSFLGIDPIYGASRSLSYLQSTAKTTEATAPSMQDKPISQSSEKGKMPFSLKGLVVKAIKIVGLISLVCIYPKLAIDALVLMIIISSTVFLLTVYANPKEYKKIVVEHYLHGSRPTFFGKHSLCDQLADLTIQEAMRLRKFLSERLQNIFKPSSEVCLNPLKT